MFLHELVDGVEGLAIERPGHDPQLAHLEIDSRRVNPGTLFVALEGAAADGHDYLASAVDRGAVAVLVNRHRLPTTVSLAPDVAVCVADDTRRRLGPLASRWHGHPSDDLGVVGITGTNGKTTITFLIEAALTHAGDRVGAIGTVNYRWPGVTLPAANTTPESSTIQDLLARMRDDGVDAVAMEVSSHGLSTHRLERTSFDVGVFTNLSQDHLDFHRTMESYRDAKASLFLRHLPDSAARGKAATAVLNIDDPEGARLAQLVGDPVRVVTYGHSEHADWSCTGWHQSLDGTSISARTPRGDLELTTHLLGEFNVANVLATLAACDALGGDLQGAIEGLSALRGVPGRLQHFGGGDRPHVFVDYAHTPDALARALAALRPLTSGRLVVIFGCGGDRDRDKRPRMGEAARRGADLSVLTSDNPRTEDPLAIIRAIAAAFDDSPQDVSARRGWAELPDRREAIEKTLRAADPDDVILIAGKGHETYQEIRGVRTTLSDVEVVEEVFR